jgi:hypothetical protein
MSYQRGFWSIDPNMPGGTAAYIENATTPNATLREVSDDVRAIWTVQNKACASSAYQQSDSVSYVRFVPETPIAATDKNQTLCVSNGTVQLFGNTRPSDNIAYTAVWSVVSGPSTIDFIYNGEDPTRIGLQPGNSIIQLKYSSQYCPEDSDRVSLEVFDIPTIQSFSDTNICGDTLQVSATLASGETGYWSIASGDAEIDDPTAQSTILRNVVSGTGIEFTAQNQVCAPSVSAFTVFTEPKPVVEVVEDTVRVCGLEALLQALPTNGTGQEMSVWKSVDPANTVAQPNSDSTAVVVSSVGQHEFYLVVNTIETCPSDSVKVIVQAAQVEEAVLAGENDLTVCGDSVVLIAQKPLTGTGVWQPERGSSASATMLTDSTAIARNLNSTQPNVFTWTVSNGSCSDDTSITVNAVNAPVANVVRDTILNCGPEGITLEAVDPGTGVVKRWIENEFVQIDNITSPTTTALLKTSNDTSKVYWKVALANNETCLADSVEVLIIQYQEVQAGSVTITSLATSCADSLLLRAETPSSGTGTWTSTTTGVDITVVTDTTAWARNLQNTNTVVWSVVNGNCPLETDTLAVSFVDLSGYNIIGEVDTTCEAFVSIAADPLIGAIRAEWMAPSDLSTTPIGNQLDVENIPYRAEPYEIIWKVSDNDDICQKADTFRVVSRRLSATDDRYNRLINTTYSLPIVENDEANAVTSVTLLGNPDPQVANITSASVLSYTGANVGVDSVAYKISNGVCEDTAMVFINLDDDQDTTRILVFACTKVLTVFEASDSTISGGEISSFSILPDYQNAIEYEKMNDSTYQVKSCLANISVDVHFEICDMSDSCQVVIVNFREGVIDTLSPFDRTLINLARVEIEVFNALSANGDEENAFFTFDLSGQYQVGEDTLSQSEPLGYDDIVSAEVIVANRWGELLYQSPKGKNYLAPDFEKWRPNEDILEGTYYYRIDITFGNEGKGSESASGPLLIVK